MLVLFRSLTADLLVFPSDFTDLGVHRGRSLWLLDLCFFWTLNPLLHRSPPTSPATSHRIQIVSPISPSPPQPLVTISSSVDHSAASPAHAATTAFLLYLLLKLDGSLSFFSGPDFAGSPFLVDAAAATAASCSSCRHLPRQYSCFSSCAHFFGETDLSLFSSSPSPRAASSSCCRPRRRAGASFFIPPPSQAPPLFSFFLD